MENRLHPRKFSLQNKIVKKNFNFQKNNPDLVSGKDNNDEKIPKNFSSLVKKRRKNKFNSIDNMTLYYSSNKLQNKKKENVTYSPDKNNIIPTNGNYNTEYFIGKLYEDEPHLKKSVFRKKTRKINLKNYNRKVSFISPKNSKKNQNIINLIKTDKNLNFNFFETNDSKSKLIKDDYPDEQSYGYDKNYTINVIKNPKKEELTKNPNNDKNKFKERRVKRKETSKTCKLNPLKRRRSEKMNTSKTNQNFKRFSRKNVTSKSTEKKYKKKYSKIIKENKEKSNSKEKTDNKNNNEENKVKTDENKTKKCMTMNDKNNKNIENFQRVVKEEEKNNKKQELSPKKPIDNVETLVQIENQNKKSKKKFWCSPFFFCLNMNNNEENENDVN